MLRARRAIRNRYRTPLGAATARRYRMRSNPGMAGGVVGAGVSALKVAMPVVLSLYGARAISYRLAPRIPGFNRIPAQFQGTVMSLGLLAGGHVLTKKVRFLQKYRMGTMIGLAVNVFDNVISAFAPASVKGMFGIAGIYDDGLSEYVETSDYVMTDGTPIDDDITMSDYIEVGQIEEELGVEEELGLEEELGGALDRAYLGGVSQDSMLRQIPDRPMLAAVPQRSFTKVIPKAGQGYDKASVLYGGIFGGGFGG